MIFGKKVIIGPDEHSIMEGFEIANFNFHVNGNLPAVPTAADLPGGKSDLGQGRPGGLGSPGWSSDQAQTGVSA